MLSKRAARAFPGVSRGAAGTVRSVCHQCVRSRPSTPTTKQEAKAEAFMSSLARRQPGPSRVSERRQGHQGLEGGPEELREPGLEGGRVMTASRLLVLLAALGSCSSRARPSAATRTLTRAVRHRPSHEVRSPSSTLYSIGVLGPASTRKLSSSLLRVCNRALSPWLRFAKRWRSRTRRLLRWSAKRTVRSLNATAALTYRACNRTAALTYRACNRTATLLVVVPLRRTAAWLGLTATSRGARRGAGRGVRARLSPSQCEVLDALQEELGRDHPGLARRARGAGMPLDDATLCRYLECAGWKVRACAPAARARDARDLRSRPSAFAACVQRPIGVRRDS